MLATNANIHSKELFESTKKNIPETKSPIVKAALNPTVNFELAIGLSGLFLISYLASTTSFIAIPPE